MALCPEPIVMTLHFSTQADSNCKSNTQVLTLNTESHAYCSKFHDTRDGARRGVKPPSRHTQRGAISEGRVTRVEARKQARG